MIMVPGGDGQSLSAEHESSKEALITRLRHSDISTAIAEYDGEGDEGFIENIALYLRSDPGQPEIELVDSALARAVEDFIWDLLEAVHPGWEINDGSCGRVVIDTTNNAVQIEHINRSSSEYYSEQTF